MVKQFENEKIADEAWSYSKWRPLLLLYSKQLTLCT